jgi:hypothetical protein
MGVKEFIVNSLSKSLKTATNNEVSTKIQNSNNMSMPWDVRHRLSTGEVHPDTDPSSLEKHVNNTLISLNWSLLNNIYKDIPLIKKAVQIPIDYATRHDLTINVDQLDNQDTNKILYEIKRHNLEVNTSIAQEIYRAEELRQIFGGCYIILDDGQDMQEEFNINADYFCITAKSIWDVSYVKDTRMSKSSKEYITDFFNAGQIEYYYVFGKPVHHSRVLKFKTNYTIDFYSRITRGWGLSIMEHLKTPLIQMLSLNRLITEYVADGKMNILKLKDYRSLLSSQSDTSVSQFMERLRLFNTTKNSMSLTALDAEDDYEYKTLNLAGFEGIVKITEERFASAVGLSRSLLLGEVQSGIGNNMTGFNNDLMFIEKKQKDMIAMYEPIVKLLIRHLFKIEVDQIGLSFQSVRPLDGLEKSTRDNNVLQKIQMAQSMGLITTEEARQEMIKCKLMESITE